MDSSTRSAAVLGRFQSLLRDRSWIADLVLAVLVGVVGAVSRPTLSFATGEQAVYSLVVFGSSLALVFRRVRPKLVLTLIGFLLALHFLVTHEVTVYAGAVCFVSAYTTQTQISLPWRWGYASVIYLSAGAAALVSSSTASESDWTARATVAAVALAMITIAVLGGIVRRNRQMRYEDAVERTASLEARRETERRLAAIEERTRIAREMHDVLGHSLNTIAVQAEGVRTIVRTDPSRTDQVLADIGRLSRDAVDDIRDLINVLTDDDDNIDAPTRPTPALGDVVSLIDNLKYTKASIRLQVDGDLDSVPGAISLAGYRIIQEGLTNVLKHAYGATAVVRIHVTQEHAVDVTIRNSAPCTLHAGTGDSSHRGIIGMQERARALGGTLVAESDPDTGGWRVAAALPWRHL